MSTIFKDIIKLRYVLLFYLSVIYSKILRRIAKKGFFNEILRRYFTRHMKN